MEIIALQTRLAAMAGAPVLVVGDVMVDYFVYGTVSRVSAEAPVPVLARVRDSVMLGGAGNVACNLAVLGGAPTLLGVFGVDTAADEGRALIGEGMKAALVADPDRATTTKTRFISAGQQLLRVDQETVRPVAGAVEEQLVEHVAHAAAEARAVLLSDYGKGVVTPRVIAACLAAAKAAGAPLIVDSKARHFGHYGEADLVKPNAA
jgi:D-beta-D-heptose 7-phosphate kinase/D-beta-D-heptose 1-phosphate adenosyltransferase